MGVGWLLKAFLYAAIMPAMRDRTVVEGVKMRRDVKWVEGRMMGIRWGTDEVERRV
jgi:hypothetical protein